MATPLTPFSTEDFWASPDNIDQCLASKLLAGSTSLVLGAGASHGFHLPDWGELVEAVRTSCGATAPTKPLRPEDEAHQLLINNFSGDRLAFAKAVRTALYAGASRDSSFLLKSDLLQGIAAFLSSSLRGHGGAVITFNFDDLVETYLRLLGFVVKSELSVPAWATRADMRVFHPHGLLPLASEAGTTPIVFTTADFDEVVGRADDEWNRTMTSILSTTFPVFIGLSGEDSRLRSLLTHTHPTHPALTKDASLYWGVRLTLKSAAPYEIDRWKAMKIAPRYFDSYSEIPAWLLTICQRAAQAHSRS